MESTELSLRQIAQMASDNNGGAKGRELDRIAKSKGLTLSYTTVNKIIAGTYTSRPGIKTVEALATLAGVPMAEAYNAAGIEAPQASLAEQLPPDADTLTPRSAASSDRPDPCVHQAEPTGSRTTAGGGGT